MEDGCDTGNFKQFVFEIKHEFFRDALDGNHATVGEIHILFADRVGVCASVVVAEFVEDEGGVCLVRSLKQVDNFFCVLLFTLDVVRFRCGTVAVFVDDEGGSKAALDLRDIFLGSASYGCDLGSDGFFELLFEEVAGVDADVKAQGGHSCFIFFP